MFSNRFAHFLNPDAIFSVAFAAAQQKYAAQQMDTAQQMDIPQQFDAAQQAQSPYSPAAQAVGATNCSACAGTMVLMPSFTPSSWQEQVYRLAYQKALVDTAPPRHFARFFSVWN